MAPRRKYALAQKENSTSWTALLHDYGMQFVGPLPPTKWPEPYKHHFEKIREIGKSLFDSYEANSTMSKKGVLEQISRVDDICREARELRQSDSYNEATWRDMVEHIAVERFRRQVNCARCSREQYEADFWAQPFTEYEQQRLAKKRRDRKICQCHQTTQKISKSRRNGEQNTALFRTLVGQEVYHHSKDDMEGISNVKISMQPDRTIGIRLHDKYERLIANSSFDIRPHPGEIRNVIYPFCVLEAKKEHKAPGFRAVEAQTAFPIRRFLLMQMALRDASNGDMHPLVWFLANQGDIWRLYAAIPIDDKINVFDLWLGSVESEDGALQLLQIMDYIWTWARDIYRRQIRQCLRTTAGYLREDSLTTTAPPSRTQSVLSEKVDCLPSAQCIPLMRSGTTRQPIPISENIRFRKVAFDPLSTWTDGSTQSIEGSYQCIVRHADRVTFVCNILSLDYCDDLMDADECMQTIDPSTVFGTLAELYKSGCVFQLTLGQLRGIKERWLGRRRSDDDSSELLSACLLVRNQYARSDWQLSRTLHCLVMSPQSSQAMCAADGNDGVLQMIHTSLDRLRCISGRLSVLGALQPVPLVLRNTKHNFDENEKSLTWMALLEGNTLQTRVLELLDHFEGKVDSWPYSTGEHMEHETLEIVRQRSHGNTSSTLPYEIDGVCSDEAEAILILKPSTWPEQCPIFCVFIFRQVHDDPGYHESTLELVRQTIQAKKILGISDEDKRLALSKKELNQLLKRWEMSFSSTA